MTCTSAVMIPSATVSTTWKSRFYNVFVSYGTGSDVFGPMTRAKYWNAIAWTTIVVATIGWSIDLVVWYCL